MHHPQTKLVAGSAAEAKLGALFLNAQEAKVFRLVLAELGHPQPPTPIHIDNTTTVGIVNNTIKRQQSRSMEMRYFWLLDGKTQQYFKFYYKPGLENLGDYPSKHHTADIHQHVRPYYVHMDNSPTLLPRAMKPSTRQGCAEILGDPYSKKSPLPSIDTSPRLAISPKDTSYPILGQSRIHHFTKKWLERHQYSAATAKQSQFKEAALAAQEQAAATEEGETQAMMFALLQEQHQSQLEAMAAANKAAVGGYIIA
jgi:hypothetical protein